MISRSHIKTFLGFVVLSGMGWVCDFATYTLLVQGYLGVDASPFVANFISSYAGVTFVYATALRLVFNKVTDKHTLFLSCYWGYQFVSILAYSAILNSVVTWTLEVEFFASLMDIQYYAGIVGKIIITPFNLITNFIFMKYLTRFMNDKAYHHV